MCEPIVKHCISCGNKISDISLRKSGGKRMFCSRACSVDHRILSAKIRNEKKCDFCKKSYSSTTGRNIRFCSAKCQRSSVFRDTSASCFVCGSVFTPVRIYLGKYIKNLKKTPACCSISCTIIKRKWSEGKKCLSCNVQFTPVRFFDGVYENYTQLNYCSRDCSLDAMSESLLTRVWPSKCDHPNWQGGGKRRGYRGSGWQRIAESVRVMAGRKCEHCGLDESDNGRRLDVNHIVPFHQSKNKSQANKTSNLEALCRSCHMLADAKWRKENPIQVVIDFVFDN